MLTPSDLYARSKSPAWTGSFLFGETSLRTAVREFVSHYLRERHHQSLGNRLILPEGGDVGNKGTIHCRQRLGGMLSYYHLAA